MREFADWFVMFLVVVTIMLLVSILDRGLVETMATLGRSLRAFREGAGL